MLERIVLWGLVVSGHRRIGNYVRIDGRFVHKDKVVFDFICGIILGVITILWGLAMYMAFKYII